MSDGHDGPEDKEQEGQAPEQANEAEIKAAETPVASEEPPAEKPAPKKRAPRKPKAAVETSATEQSEMAIEKPASAKPAAKRAASKPAEPPPPPPVDEEKASAFRSPVVIWSMIGGAVVILAAAGYIAWTQFAPHQAGGTASNALANRSICEATLDRVQAYGVLPAGTSLAQADPDKTQTDGRVTCHAQSGEMQYAMTVDVACDDMGKESCIKLYSVKQADGTALFQRQM